MKKIAAPGSTKNGAEPSAPFELPTTGFVREKQMLLPGVVPIGRSTLWAWIKAGTFPAPVKLGPSTTAWRCADVHAWMGTQK